MSTRNGDHLCTSLQTALFHGHGHQLGKRQGRVPPACRRGTSPADLIAQRIVQLGGEPNLSPDGIQTRSHSEYVEGNSLVEMIKEDLVAERIAIDSYRDMITYLGDDDPTSRRMLEEILAKEEEHAEDLVSLLKELG